MKYYLESYIYILLFLFLYISLPLTAQEKFRHPLVVGSGDVYRFVAMDYVHSEEKTPDVYTRTRSLTLKGEYSFYKYYALTAQAGNSFYEKTDSAAIRRNERMSAGVKFARTWKGKFLSGFHLKGYGTNKNNPQREGENLNLFLIEGGFSFGYKFTSYEVLANVFLQSESNFNFREEYGQQFRRFYQAELSVSRKLYNNFALFLESSYRMPYNREIDKDSLSWYFYPGVSLISSLGTLGISAQLPVNTLGMQDRGGKISYFYFF